VTKSGPATGGHVERRTVSRKTPGDGKLEITSVAAHRLESLGTSFSMHVGDRAGQGSLGSMPCTCRGGETPHVHHFIESELLRALVPGSSVDLVFDASGHQLLVVPA
jgi:hypothetical protein